jgi:hypothetical protein
VLVIEQAVTKANFTGEAVDREVHSPDPPGGLIVLLPVDRDLARLPPVTLDEVGRLDEQAAGAAGGIEYPPLVGPPQLFLVGLFDLA